MPKGDMISLMADEVIHDIEEKGVDFRRAFSWAAHRRDIWHHINVRHYNETFALVRSRVSERNNGLLRRAMRNKQKDEAEIIQALTERDALVGNLPENEIESMLAFTDNIGYQHFSVSTPFLDAPPSD